MLRVRRRLDEILAHHTGKPIDVITRDSDRDFFMSPEEGKDYGLIDEIIQARSKSGGDGSSPRVSSNGGGLPRGDTSGGPEVGGGAATR